MPSYHQQMTERLGRPAVIAIGFAIVALLTSVVAVIVVMRRHAEPAFAETPAPAERVIEAKQILKLKRDVVEKVEGGVRIKDEAMRTALGLEPGDVITAINGRLIEREFDVYDAVLGMSAMDASIVYVEVIRGKAPALVRWKLDGDLREARRDSVRPAPLANPFTAPPDPLVDSIKRIDALHYTVPKSTVETILANPDTFSRQARIVPAIRTGQPDGFKLYAIRPGSLWSAIGLQNGDTIRAINGHDLSTPDKALKLYAMLKDATELQIQVRRRDGTEEIIAIAIQ